MSIIVAREFDTSSVAAKQHFDELHKLFPSLPEPQKGAAAYATTVMENPGLDDAVCKAAGKVVHIIARSFEPLGNHITIRGSHKPLDWSKDFQPDPHEQEGRVHERTFTFHIPPDHMNDTIQFKLCMYSVARKAILWQSGYNRSIDLKNYGHFVKVDIREVTFDSN
jgi:hypothetical protein